MLPGSQGTRHNCFFVYRCWLVLSSCRRFCIPFFFCLASVGLPGLNGFVGEFLTLLGAFQADQLLGWPYAAAAGVGMIFAAIYILYMVGKVVFGPLRVPGEHGADGHAPPGDLNKREIWTLAPIAVMCLFLGLYPKPVLNSLDDPLAKLIAPAQQYVQQLEQANEQPQLAMD